MATTARRARGVLKVKRKNTNSVTGRAGQMADGIDGNAAIFTNPNPPTATMRNQVTVVTKAEGQTKTRTVGAAAVRTVQLNVLLGMMETQLVYIQGCADKAQTYDQAVSILQAGGVAVAGVGAHPKEVITIKQGLKQGSVVLDANVGMLTAGLKGKFSFNWQSTLDGKSFTTLPSTPNHLTTVDNLTPQTNVGFRVSVTDAKGGVHDWSQTVYSLVH